MLHRRRRFHKLRNLAQSAMLVLGMALVAGLCAWVIWGPGGIFWAIAGVVLAMVVSPSIPPAFVLQLYRARPLEPAEFPKGYAILTELARRAGLPQMPTLYYVASSVLNAFAVGSRNSAAIAVTDGLLRTLNLRQLMGVLAHEVSHVRNNDLWIMGLADTMSRLTSLLSYFGLFLLALNLPLLLAGAAVVPWLLVAVLVLAPTLMSLLQLALSRSREFDADLDAAELSGDPVGLASALEHMNRLQGRFWEEILLPGRRIPQPSLLRSHPPTAERIRRLLELAEPTHPPMTRRPSEPLALPVALRIVESRPRWRWPGLWY